VNHAEKFRQLTCTQEVRADLRRSSVRAAGATWMASAADFILRLGSTAILARLILPEHFGLVMMVMAVTAIADQFRDLGLSTATVQRKDITHGQVSNLFWINVAAGTLIALAVCALSPLVSAYYKDSRLTVITCILATNFVFGGLMAQHQALLARQLKLGHSAMVRVLSSLISTIIAIILALMHFGYWALVWREVIRCVLLAVGMWICFPWIPGLPSRKTDIRELLGFGAHLSAANIVVSTASSLDRLLIGHLWGAAPVAIYRQAYQLLVVPMDQFLSPMFNVTQPGLSMIQNDAARYRRFYEKVLKIVCIITMPMSLFVAANSAEITRLILGRKWLGCAGVLSILSLGTFIKSPVGWSELVLITRGRSKRFLGLAILENTTRVILMLFGARWGVTGVSIAFVAATYLAAPATLFIAFRGSPVSLGSFLSAVARPAASSCVMASLLFIFHQMVPPLGSPIFLVLSSFLGFSAFSGTWLLLPGGKADLKELFSDVLAFRRSKVDRSIESPKLPIAVIKTPA
jgi:O-antigen/teichoic acid export membrane protein